MMSHIHPYYVCQGRRTPPLYSRDIRRGSHRQCTFERYLGDDHTRGLGKIDIFKGKLQLYTYLIGGFSIVASVMS